MPQMAEALFLALFCSFVSNLSFSFFLNPGVEWQQAQQGDQRPGTILLLAAWQLVLHDSAAGFILVTKPIFPAMGDSFKEPSDLAI